MPTLLHNGHNKIPLIGLFLGPIVVRFKKEIGETCVCTFFVSSLQVAEVPTGKKKPNQTHPRRASGSGGLTLHFVLVQYKTCLCVWLPVRKPKGRLQLLLFGLLQPLNVMAELERRPQLQSHVLHDDVTAQQHQGLTIDLLRGGKGGAVSQRA